MVHENDAPRDARAGRIARGRGGGHFSQRAWRCALWARDLRAPRLTSAEKNLLLILALREHPKTGGSFASIATLSGDTGLNRQTVIKAAQGLERHGLLTRTHRARQPVLYRVTPPPGVLEEREIPGSTGAPIESEIPNSIGSPCNTKIGQMEYEIPDTKKELKK